MDKKNTLIAILTCVVIAQAAIYNWPTEDLDKDFQIEGPYAETVEDVGDEAAFVYHPDEIGYVALNQDQTITHREDGAPLTERFLLEYQSTLYPDDWITMADAIRYRLTLVKEDAAKIYIDEMKTNNEEKNWHN
jgi:hypothetical protein